MDSTLGVQLRIVAVGLDQCRIKPIAAPAQARGFEARPSGFVAAIPRPPIPQALTRANAMQNAVRLLCMKQASDCQHGRQDRFSPQDGSRTPSFPQKTSLNVEQQ